MIKNYLVVFGKCAGSNFSGRAPDIPGCVSAGDTLEEMRSMMREALEFHFEGLFAEGESIPEPKTQNVEFNPEDFEDVEYFVVQKLAVNVPAGAEQFSKHQAA
jgi:predicted RNase H-like HicB family nuclease